MRENYRTLPGFGRIVAIDSTTLKGWTNGARATRSDPDAGWSVKGGSQGTKEYVLGYKLHLGVCAEYELPISANMSAGNVSDVTRASNVLRETRFTHRPFRPDWVLLDAGYSSGPLKSLIYRQYRARPMIRPKKNHPQMVKAWEWLKKQPG